MFKLILHAQKLEFLLMAFAVNLSAVALLMVQTFELNLEVILYISFFVLQVQETALNPRSVFKPTSQQTDFVFTFKSILYFCARTFWTQN